MLSILHVFVRYVKGQMDSDQNEQSTYVIPDPEVLWKCEGMEQGMLCAGKVKKVLGSFN